MGLKFGVLRFFPYNQNNHDSSGAYVQRSECKDKYAWNIAWRTMFVDIFCLRLLPFVWSANTPTWRPMADDTITWDSIFQFWDDILWEEMKWNDYANTWKTLEGGNENEITNTCPNPPSKVVQYHIWFQPGTVSLITLHGSPDRYNVITHIFLF